MLAMDSSFSTVLSRQNAGFDVSCRNGFAEYGFPEIDRVEDHLAIALPDGDEGLAIVLHDRTPASGWDIGSLKRPA
jgi:hypothetical protein